MKKCFSVLLWIISFLFSGILVTPVSDLIKEKKWFCVEGPIYHWLNEPVYTNLQFIVFVILLSLFVVLGYKIINYYLSNESKKKKNSPEELLKQVNFVFDNEHHLKATWDVGFGTIYNKDPFPYNIKLWCLLHETPQLMDINGCAIPGCANNHFIITEAELKRRITSFLFGEYEKLKNQNNDKKKKKK